MLPLLWWKRAAQSLLPLRLAVLNYDRERNSMAHTIVIFGASGDLTSRKLIPALYQLHRKRRLPADALVVGSARTAYSDEAWRDELGKSTAS